MTKRDFFILAIKLFGLNVIVRTVFSQIPFSIIYSFNNIDVGLLLVTAFVVVALPCLFWLLIGKAERVVDFLKLDKGFQEERIDLGSLKAADIVKISIFIIGGMVMFNYIPIFLNQLYYAFKDDIVGKAMVGRDKSDLAVNGLNLLLGYLMMTNYQFIASWFRTKEVDE